MKKNANRKAKPQATPPRKPALSARTILVIAAFLIVSLSLAAVAWLQRPAQAPLSNKTPSPYQPRPAGTVTFNRDIAPILFANCSPCHRHGESAPFNLLTYEDARSRAQLIAKVTHARLMPPWLPEDGLEELRDRRGLSAQEIGLLAQWVDEGARQGEAADLPAPPKWAEGWQLGDPDLVVTMPEAYTAPADGKDVYRNFIIPLPTTKDRFVKAFEFRPSSKAVHHAFIRLDRSLESRELANESTPGFDGMTVPPTAELVAGHFLSWQPGRGATQSPDGLPWTLPGGADIVLLMHMQPTGKAESVRASIGFYFTDVPATNTPVKIGLRSFNIDIPPNSANYVVEQSATLPADADLLAVLPHAHYVAKKIEAIAILPDQTRKSLLRIPNWDFNWQSEFRFATPVHLPKGSTLAMRYVYDNSTNNLRNPFQIPVPIKYGLQTTQEMAELYFQLLARNSRDLAALRKAAHDISTRNIQAMNNRRLQDDPNDAGAILEIAKQHLNSNNLVKAASMARRAIALRPDLADGPYTLGVILMDQSLIPESEQEFLKAIQLNPRHYKAHNNVGLIYLNVGRPEDAARHFQEALRIRPKDKIAQANLDLAMKAISQ